MGENNVSPEKGGELLNLLMAALRELEAAGGKKGMSEYRAYLHGQVYGLAMALRLMFPGPGNLGEKAALALRPLMTEHLCRCGDEESPEN
ncbi:MAG: hypothetical protein ACYC4H_11150 [Desulfocucumaceae bacterium]